MMATNWKQVSSLIDRKTDHIVYGFVHEIERALDDDESDTIIPPLIIFTILMYYWINDKG